MSKEKDDSRTSIFTTKIEPVKDKNNSHDACIVIISGHEENKKFDLFSQKESDIPIKEVTKTFNIGRSQSDNDIVIHDKYVSSTHAEIVQEGDKFFIKDRESTNGTFLNDVKIKDTISLKSQDKIKIGDTILKFLQGDIEALFLDNLRKKVNIDGLTEIYNKQYFEENFRNAFTAAKRYNKKLSLILFDIDNFKKINDNYGHDAGDFVLSKLSDIMKSRIRKTDIFARIGGEEFAIICIETDIENSYKLAEVLRSIVSVSDFIYETIKIPVTISLGTCELNSSMNDEKEMFRICDSLLYKSKKSGKNRVSK